jgi:hypothetical protein
MGETKDIREAAEAELGFDPLADPAGVAFLVHNAPDRYALIPDDSDIAVEASGNTVTLTGHARTRTEHDAVIGATWMASGVNDIRDEIYVTGCTKGTPSCPMQHPPSDHHRPP